MMRKRAPRKQKKPLKKGLSIALGILMGLALLLMLIDGSIRGPLTEAAREKAEEAARLELSAACASAIGETGELIPTLISEQERDTLVINVDAAKLDLLMTLASREAQERIAQLGSGRIGLDAGSLMSSALLSGMGPRVSIGFEPIGSVRAEASSRLRSAGINQTLFTVDLTLTACIRVFAAGSASEITVSQMLPVCSTVIVGNVPQVYTNVANEEDMLNLIPNELP